MDEHSVEWAGDLVLLRDKAFVKEMTPDFIAARPICVSLERFLAQALSGGITRRLKRAFRLNVIVGSVFQFLDLQAYAYRLKSESTAIWNQNPFLEMACSWLGFCLPI